MLVVKKYGMSSDLIVPIPDVEQVSYFSSICILVIQRNAIEYFQPNIRHKVYNITNINNSMLFALSAAQVLV